MDYARFNYVAQPEDGISHDGIFPRINDYDDWAIRWGYTIMPEAKTSEEDHAAIESLCEKYLDGNKRLWWGDGEGLRGYDPRRQTEDLGDDAVKASEYGIKNLKRELAHLPEWTYEKTDMYDQNLQSMYQQIRNQFMRYAGHVIGNIGGTYVTFKTVDQQGERYELVSKSHSKYALDYVNRNLFTEPAWLRDMKFATRMTNEPLELTLSCCHNNHTVCWVNRLPYMTEAYSAGDFLTDVNSLIMKDLGAQKITRYRRELQDEWVDSLIDLYKSYTTSAPQALVILKQLKNRLATVTGGDNETKAHVAMMSDKIQRALIIK